MKERNTPKRRARRADWRSLRAGGLVPGAVLALSLQAAAVSLLAAAPALAQPLDNVSREAATALAIAGLEAYEAGHYAEALDKLEKSYTVARVPTLGLWSARALHKLGRWLEAKARYEETVTLPLPEVDTDTQQQAQQDARTELAALEPTIPQLVLQLDGATPEQLRITIDGKVVTSSEPVYRLNPGAHHIEGDRGDARQAVDVQLGPGDSRTVLLRFPGHDGAAAYGAVAPAPGSGFEMESGEGSGTWLRPAGWTAMVLGGAGMAVGTVSLVLAVQKKDEIDHDDRCNGSACAPSRRELVDSYDSRRNLSTAGFVAGTALIALGVTALVLSSAETEAPSAEAVFSPTFTGIRGTF